MAFEFRIPESKISVIPFGINNTVPNTLLSHPQAKGQLRISKDDKVLLFFGNIAPYRLLIVGSPKGSATCWKQIRRGIETSSIADRLIEKIEYVPDEETELYFKAADVLILPILTFFKAACYSWHIALACLQSLRASAA